MHLETRSHDGLKFVIRIVLYSQRGESILSGVLGHFSRRIIRGVLCKSNMN